jgi:hypothetical protein
MRRSAIAKLKQSGVTRYAYVDYYFGPGATWGGDRCGCVDDRCIGFHHDQTQECGCLQGWIDELLINRCSTEERG